MEIEQIGADDVTRHQIRCELDTAEPQANAAGKNLRHQGFRRTRWPFQQDMSLGHQPHQHQVQRIPLANHDLSALMSQTFGDKADIIQIHGSTPFSTCKF